MKKIGIIYDYLFYTIYRFWEKAPSRWWSDWKTVITMCVLIVCMLLSVYGMIMYVLEVDLLPRSGFLPLSIGLIIYVFNYFRFLHKDKWKKRVFIFEKLNHKKDLLGIVLVIFLFLLVISNLLYSIYLISSIDWKIPK